MVNRISTPNPNIVNIQYNQDKKNVSYPIKTNNKLERTPESDEYNKGLSDGAKAGLCVGGALALFTVGDLIFNKGRCLKKLFGKADDVAKSSGNNSTSNTSLTTSGLKNFKKGLAYNDKGELLTGTISNVSKNGNKMESHYIDGVLVKREFTPADQSEIKKIVKSYDTKSHEGVRIAFSEIEKADGTIEYSRIANFTERKFSPEIESKIKMKDFDNADFSKLEKGTKDLGDGLTLEFDGDFYSLKQNGKLVRQKYATPAGVASYGKGDFELWKDPDGLYSWFTIINPKGSVNYYPKGNFSEVIMFDEHGKTLDRFIYNDYDALGKLISKS